MFQHGGHHNRVSKGVSLSQWRLHIWPIPLVNLNDPKAVETFWQTATIKRGRGRPASDVKRPTLNMRVDADVLEAFKATGPGWQTRINAVLLEAVRKGL